MGLGVTTRRSREVYATEVQNAHTYVIQYRHCRSVEKKSTRVRPQGRIIIIITIICVRGVVITREWAVTGRGVGRERTRIYVEYAPHTAQCKRTTCVRDVYTYASAASADAKRVYGVCTRK